MSASARVILIAERNLTGQRDKDLLRFDLDRRRRQPTLIGPPTTAR
jgi:hypothetical protein